MSKKRELERIRIGELDTDYINSLRQRVQDLEALAEERLQLIRCLEAKERRLRIWNISFKCGNCPAEHVWYVAFVNKKVYYGPDYKKLVQKLRTMGYLVQERVFEEKPPAENKPFDGECEFMKGDVDLRDLRIPDVVPDEILRELEGEGGTKS